MCVSDLDGEFEAELRQSLERVQAPAELLDAVMKRTRAAPGRSVSAAKQQQSGLIAGWPSLLFLAASLLVAVGSALEGHHQEQVRRERQATRVAAQFNQAMFVTARTLAHIDDNVSQAVSLSVRKL